MGESLDSCPVSLVSSVSVPVPYAIARRISVLYLPNRGFRCKIQSSGGCYNVLVVLTLQRAQTHGALSGDVSDT